MPSMKLDSIDVCKAKGKQKEKKKLYCHYYYFEMAKGLGMEEQHKRFECHENGKCFVYKIFSIQSTAEAQ